MIDTEGYVSYGGKYPTSETANYVSLQGKYLTTSSFTDTSLCYRVSQ